MTLVRHASLWFVALSLVACGDDKPRVTPDGTTPLPASYALAAEPAGAVPILEAKKTGDTVTILGRVGGSDKPFADTRAVFTLVDPSIKTCDELPGDNCPKPWDYCCEPADSLTAASATVEFRDGDRPRVATARGFHGLAPLKTAIVTGRAERDEAGNLVVVASGVYVRP